ncbi:MAG: hypothetical protein PHW24_03115 [Candidatus Moranbacteria bacterium]|nr:hypothetical protein [Candidatus Moranbacteria bacterium]
MKTNKKMATIAMTISLVVLAVFAPTKKANAGPLVDAIMPFIDPFTSLIIADAVSCDINIIWGCDKNTGAALAPTADCSCPDGGNLARDSRGNIVCTTKSSYLADKNYGCNIMDNYTPDSANGTCNHMGGDDTYSYPAIVVGLSCPNGGTPDYRDNTCNKTDSYPAVCEALAPTNGSCGSASGQSVVVAPSSATLCFAGTASAVSGNGPWTWTCKGSNGGTDANCRAEKLCTCDNADSVCVGSKFTNSCGVLNACDGRGTSSSCVEKFTLLVNPANDSEVRSNENDPKIDCKNGNIPVGQKVCGYSYNKGTNVKLTQSVLNNSIFSGWGGDCSGPDPSCDLIMNSDKLVTTFVSPICHCIDADLRCKGDKKNNCGVVDDSCADGTKTDGACASDLNVKSWREVAP